MTNDMTHGHAATQAGIGRTEAEQDAMLAALFADAAPRLDDRDDREAFVGSVMAVVEADIARTSAWTTAIGAAVAVLGVITLAPLAPTFLGELVGTLSRYADALPVHGGTLTMLLTLAGLGGAWLVTERA